MPYKFLIKEFDLTDWNQASGQIQPYGVLLTLQEPELIILQTSSNTLSLLGIAPTNLLGHALEEFIPAIQLAQLKQCLTDTWYTNSIKLSVNQQLFDGILHRHDQVLFLELEPCHATPPFTFTHIFHHWQSSLAKLEQANSTQELCQIIATEIRKLSGFDHVIIYQFDEYWGRILAEDIATEKQGQLASYLSSPYPTIPQPARTLYQRELMRTIVDVNYTPVNLLPALNPLTQCPLDMSISLLRSASPVYLEFLQNRGIMATMTISLLREQQLWGLIACHHYTPRHIVYEQRAACLLLAQMASLQLNIHIERKDKNQKTTIRVILQQLFNHFAKEKDLIRGLTQYQPNLWNLIPAEGAAIHFDNQLITLGKCPPASDVKALIAWLQQTHSEKVFHTACLATLYPPAKHFREIASGLLVITLSTAHSDYLLWFRGEMIWKDYAEMPTAANICGNPQPSFAKPFADFTSSPWQPYEVEAALELRNVLLNLIIQRASELNRVNKELAKSNAELDTFAYVVSHDLKEPLRGIRYYVMVLLDDYGNKLNTPGIIQLETIKRLTQYMEELIESLLEYSRVGQIDLAMQPTDLNKVVEQALEILHLRHREVELTIHIPKPLPTISCDPARIGQLFANLISNAVKYNDKAKKQIEIGYQESSEKPHYLFHIRDNGIGIREHQFDKIFQVFKRLHGREQFGGGTGVGLAIVKKIVERHQGKIWVESNYGQGTTFYFTLETDEI